MDKLILVSSGHNPDWARQPATADHPVEIFYVVLSKDSLGERAHRLCSALYESLALAEAELARLRATDLDGSYCIWKSSTYIEPSEWLHRVVRSDGTLIMPRVRGVEKFGER